MNSTTYDNSNTQVHEINLNTMPPNNILNAVIMNSTVTIDSTTYDNNNTAEINLNTMHMNNILNAVTMNATVSIDSISILQLMTIMILHK